MSHLSKKEINEYNEKGYFSPIDVLTKDEANEVKEEIEFKEMLQILYVIKAYRKSLCTISNHDQSAYRACN